MRTFWQLTDEASGISMTDEEHPVAILDLQLRCCGFIAHDGSILNDG
jgi:hypothetical protein